MAKGKKVYVENNKKTTTFVWESKNGTKIQGKTVDKKTGNATHVITVFDDKGLKEATAHFDYPKGRKRVIFKWKRED
jgi:hypothetical protein